MAINAPAPLRESLDGLGDKALIKRCAAYRPGSIDTPTAAAKHALRALARRWVALDAEVAGHDRELDRLTAQASARPARRLRHRRRLRRRTAHRRRRQPRTDPLRGRIRETLRHLPHPASSGQTNRHRLYRGGHRQANAALYRVVIVPMRFHQPTIDYVTRRSAEGLTKKDIIRCLKRFVAREAYHRVMTDHRHRQQPPQTNT